MQRQVQDLNAPGALKARSARPSTRSMAWRRRGRRAVLGGMLASLAACAGPETPASALMPLSFVEWERERERYLGQVLVVDMWAMWCASCIEQFPKMVAMDRRLRDSGVRFVSMNLDDRGDAEALAEAERFVASQGADFPHYRMDERLLDGFEKMDLMGIPAVRVYDRLGRQRHHFSGDNPQAAVETGPALEAALRALVNEAVEAG